MTTAAAPSVPPAGATATVVDSVDVVDGRRLARGLAVIRILLGLTFLLNGLAKVFGIHSIHLGPYYANLIDRTDARFILGAEVNHNAKTHLPFLQHLTNDVVLPNWDAFGWGLTVVELVAGVLLVLGLFSRLGALVALVPTVFLFYVYFANDRWVPEQPLELVPLLVLLLVPSGLAWGLDGRRRRDRDRVSTATPST